MSEPTQDDFIAVKYIALSVMETAENMMDECTKRADRIKELEEELADKNRDYKVLKELRDELLEDWEKKRYAIAQLEAKIAQQSSHIRSMFGLIDNRNERIYDLTTENHGLESVIDTCTAAIRDLKYVYDRDTIGIEMFDEFAKLNSECTNDKTNQLE